VKHVARLPLAVTLALGCVLAAHARPPAAPFFFIQITDPQLGMWADNANVEQETANLEFAVATSIRLRPAFVIVTGDLVNRAGDEAQVAAYLRIMARVDPAIRVYHVPGNHDVGNTPTPDSLSRYRQWFGPDWYAFYHGGCRFVVIDTTLIHDPSKAPDEMRRQEAWLEQELTGPKRPRPVHTVLLQHHPWFNQSPDEPDAYENIPRSRRSRYLDWLTQAGVSAVFAGHRHGNSIARYGSMEIVATGPVGKPLRKDPSGLRIVEVYKDRIAHCYYPLNAVPERVCLAGR